MSFKGRITRSSYNISLAGIPTETLANFPGQAEDSLLSGYEPSLRPLALSGLAILHWAGLENPEILSTSPLNDVSHPPLHADFLRQVRTLDAEKAEAARAGAAILAVTAAYQGWMHATSTEVETISALRGRHETAVEQEIHALDARLAAGNLLYIPGTNWEVSDLAGQHAVNNTAGTLQLSAAFTERPGRYDDQGSQPIETQHYFLNLFTSFQDLPISGREGLATGRVEAGMIQRQRFATIEENAGFDRHVQFAQVLNTLVMGEDYLLDTPPVRYEY